MSGMKAKRKKTAARDMLASGQLPLWPGLDGLINPPGFRSLERLRGLESRRLLPSPRREVARASRYLRSLSLSWWLLSRSLGVDGFGMVNVSLFETWLLARLEISEFNALEVWRVVEIASEELGKPREETVRLLLALARRASRIKIESGLVTWR